MFVLPIASTKGQARSPATFCESMTLNFWREFMMALPLKNYELQNNVKVPQNLHQQYKYADQKIFWL